MKTRATRKPRLPELAAYEALAKRIRHGDDSEETAAECSKAEAAYRATLEDGAEWVIQLRFATTAREARLFLELVTNNFEWPEGTVASLKPGDAS